MLRKLLFPAVFVAVLAMAVTPAIAYIIIPPDPPTCWWSGFGTDDPHMWDNPDNWWDSQVPTSEYFASIGDPPESAQCTIDSSINAECKALFIGDWRENSFLTMTGGTLDVGTDLILGNRVTIWGNAEGTLELTGGAVTVGDDLIISVDAPGDVNVTGGSLDVTGALTIGTQGHLMVAGSGLVTFHEDITATANSYIGAGKIYAPASYIAVCDYNTTIPGKTAVYTVSSSYLDIKEDFYVDMFDFAILGSQWLQSPGEPSADICPYGGDGIVDINDLDWLTLYWLDCLVGKADNPDPCNGSYFDPNGIFHWSAGDGALSHDVYLGADYDDVKNATLGSYEYQDNVDVNAFDPCGLDVNTAYFWRIDEVGPECTQKGDVWGFTTED